MNNQVQPQPQPQPEPPVQEEPKKSLSWLWWVVLVLIMIAAGIWGYWYYTQKKASQETAPAEEVQEDTQTPDEEATEDAEEDEGNDDDDIDISGWETYTNELFGYTLKYPPAWDLEEKKPGEYTTEGICVEITHGETLINIGQITAVGDFDGCFRTGVGSHEIEHTNVDYIINGSVYTVDEWYEKTEWSSSIFGNIYGAQQLDEYGDMAVYWGFEYWGAPKEDFEEDRAIVELILESITW